MPSELVQRMREKYPTEYADLSDAELEQRVLAKFPEYRDLASTPTSAASSEPSLLSRAGSMAQDLGVGAVKGAGQTATNLGRLVHTIPGVTPAVNALWNQVYPQTSAPSVQQTFGEANRVLTPTNTSQKVGKGIEQIAELIAPSQAITEAGMKTAATMAPRLTQSLGPILARALPRAVVEGAGAAGMAGAQGGNPIIGGTLGAVAPMVGEAVSGIPQALKDSAAKKVMNALGPTKERFKAIATRITPEILNRGLGGSREALQQQAANTLETVSEQLDAAMTAHGTQAIPTQPILDSLEKAKAAFRLTTEMPVGQAMQRGLLDKAASVTGNVAQIAVEFEPRSIRQLSGLQNVVSQLGDTATVSELTAIRRAWDKVVSQAGGYAQRAGGAIGVPLKDQSEAWAKREGAGAIRKILADQVPDLAAVNKEYSFWKNLDDVLTQTIQRTQPHGPGLLKQGAELGGQVIGGMAGSVGGPGGTIGGAMLVGKLAKWANAAFSSPRWQFVSANLRNQLADAMMSGSAKRTASILGQIAAVQGAKAVPAAGR